MKATGLFGLVFSCALTTAAAMAADVTWTVSSGDFNVGSNWAGGSVPGSGNNASIANGGTATISANVATTPDSVSVGYDGGNGTLVQTAGNLSYSYSFLVGGYGSGAGTSAGVFNMSGGSLTKSTSNYGRFVLGDYGNNNGIANITNGSVVNLTDCDVLLGNYSSSTGVLNLNSSTFSTNNPFIVGYGQTTAGTLNMSGSSIINCQNTFFIGHDTNATGVVTLHDTSTLNVAGDVEVGNWNNSSGTLNVHDNASVKCGYMHVGYYDNTTGVLNIDGGTITSSGMTMCETSNGAAQGTVNQSGGLITLTSNPLYMAQSLGASATYNLSGGTIKAAGVVNSGGNATLYFNGGVLQATAGNTSYMPTSASFNAYVQAGRAIIDTNGNNIQCNNVIATDPALLAVSGTDGGLIKQGAGKLGLAGNNSYNGPTTVNAGTLLITGNPTSTGAIEVKSGATLGTDTIVPAVKVDAGGTFAAGYTFSNLAQTGTAQPASLTTASGGILAFKLSNSTNAGNDQIDVAGNMSLASSTVINISQLLNNSLALGTYPLILAPSNSTAIGSPLYLTGTPLSRQSYSLSSSLTEVVLDVSAGSAANLVWAGSSSNNFWDVKVTKNWLNTGAGNQRDYFYNLDNVTFDDSGAANGAVNLNAAVQPGSVTLTMTNASSAYSFSGTGSIIGNTGLVMNGKGSLTVNTANSYTGETDIHGGSVVINSGGALGDTSGQNATYIGGPSASDSASAAVHSGGTLSGASLVLGNAAGSTGALTQNGGVVNAANGSLIVGSSGVGSVNLSAGAINVNGPGSVFMLGNATGSSGTLTQTGGTINANGGFVAGSSGAASVNLSGSGVLNVSGVGSAFSIGDSASGVGTFVQGGNSVVSLGTSGQGIGYASIARAGTASYTLNSGSLTAYTFLNVGDLAGGSGTLNVNGGFATVSGALYIGKTAATGIANISGGTLNVGTLGGSARIGGGGGMGSGTLNLSGNAVVNVTQNVSLGMSTEGDYQNSFGNGVMSVSGIAVLSVTGELDVGMGGGTGAVNLGGNAAVTVYSVDIGNNYNNQFNNSTNGLSSGTLNQTGGTLTATTGEFWVGENYGNSGVYRMSGGVLNVSNWLAVGRDGSSGTVTMTGGTINKSDNGTGTNILVGARGGIGVWNMNGGLINNTTGLAIGDVSNMGTFFLNAGVVQANSVTTYAGGTGNFYFNGGTLQASGSNSNYFTATNSYIQAGGAVIDSNGYNITMANNFVPDPTLLGPDGGLTKIGQGTLILSGTNTYMGGTRVYNGTVVAMDPQAIEDGTNLSVGSDLSAFAAAIPASGAPAAAAPAVAPVPEPGTMALVAAGAALLALRRRRCDWARPRCVQKDV